MPQPPPLHSDGTNLTGLAAQHCKDFGLEALQYWTGPTKRKYFNSYQQFNMECCVNLWIISDQWWFITLFGTPQKDNIWHNISLLTFLDTGKYKKMLERKYKIRKGGLCRYVFGGDIYIFFMHLLLWWSWQMTGKDTIRTRVHGGLLPPITSNSHQS